jgi:hypothetical protein
MNKKFWEEFVHLLFFKFFIVYGEALMVLVIAVKQKAKCRCHASSMFYILPKVMVVKIA